MLHSDYTFENIQKDKVIIDSLGFFDFAMQNSKNIKFFIQKIHEIIVDMKKILYTPPY